MKRTLPQFGFEFEKMDRFNCDAFDSRSVFFKLVEVKWVKIPSSAASQFAMYIRTVK